MVMKAINRVGRGAELPFEIWFLCGEEVELQAALPLQEFSSEGLKPRSSSDV